MESVETITEQAAFAIAGGDGLERGFGWMFGLGVAAGITASPFLLALAVGAGIGILAGELLE